MTTDYQPKHMKRSGGDINHHCCFGGCRPMDEYGCCANMGWHNSGCPLDPTNQYVEAVHDAYVRSGRRKHLSSSGKGEP